MNARVAERALAVEHEHLQVRDLLDVGLALVGGLFNGGDDLDLVARRGPLAGEVPGVRGVVEPAPLPADHLDVNRIIR